MYAWLHPIFVPVTGINYVHATDISYHNVMGLGFHIVILLPYQNWKYTVKPPNKGHFGNNIKLIQVFCPL